jgi:paired small multidrug resistance pump
MFEFDFLESFADYVGMVGVVITLTAYLAISTGKISSNTLMYQVLNCVAGLMVLFSLYFHWNTPTVIMESLWVLISVVGIFRIVRINVRKNTFE